MLVNKNQKNVFSIVEGATEYFSLPHLIKKLGCNPLTPNNLNGIGDDWNLEALVRKRLYRSVVAASYKPRCDHILIVFDRESRSESAYKIADTVLKALSLELQKNNKHLTQRVSVVICDRHFENWIIADYEALTRLPYISASLATKVGTQSDGKLGKSILESVFKGKRKYHETRDAPVFCQTIDITNPKVQGRSDSLKKLVSSL